ncbi:MAG: hypothetical protein Faunusvirus40_5 [Faunusvirus sp.]|jgi:hypothetical protein|uniref:Uncharacterized protein n=1 Tax=Faunusvirus sp. TaxID=2487766 RepID=A0A3G4ZXR8_9VIRU|nr:MAG: hypothetical protein Faunusvirus40_5 [Faunusvirus sp.]
MNIKFEKIRDDNLTTKYNNMAQKMSEPDCKHAMNILYENKNMMQLFTLPESFTKNDNKKDTDKESTASASCASSASPSDTPTVITSVATSTGVSVSAAPAVPVIPDVKKYVPYVPTTIAFKSDNISKLMYKKEWFRLQDIQKINRVREFINRNSYTNNEATINELLIRIKDKKLNKKDLVYSTQTGTITSIKGLQAENNKWILV